MILKAEGASEVDVQHFEKILPKLVSSPTYFAWDFSVTIFTISITYAAIGLLTPHRSPFRNIPVVIIINVHVSMICFILSTMLPTVVLKNDEKRQWQKFLMQYNQWCIIIISSSAVIASWLLPIPSVKRCSLHYWLPTCPAITPPCIWGCCSLPQLLDPVYVVLYTLWSLVPLLCLQLQKNVQILVRPWWICKSCEHCSLA